MRAHTAVARGIIALSLALAPNARAQDFASPTAPGANADACALLDRGLPGETATLALSAARTRWWGLDELETRALAASAAWRSLRVSAGLSQTGDPELGWTSLALGLGGAAHGAGAGLRACTRRDRDAPWSVTRAFASGAGVEVGAGAWLEAAPGVRAWASAPQMWTEGASPPLARALELGVRVGGPSGAWARLVSPRAGDDGERALGVCLGLAPAQVWAEVRDAPLRGAVGLGAALGSLRVDARVDAHPVLGETTRMGLTWVRAAGTAARTP